MSNNTVYFTIQLNGNAYKALVDLDEVVGKVMKSAKKAKSATEKLGEISFHIGSITNAISGFSQGIQNAIEPGIKLNTSLQDLSAITGVTGAGLKEIEGYARQNAKAFGIDAAGAVESYKLILSQLSPEIAKTPSALKAMGESISTLSKTMGGDTTAAAEVLTTAMDQFQVATDNPIAASKEMAHMMNVMAAAAKEGSAELPQIKQALNQDVLFVRSRRSRFEPEE